VGFPFFLLKFRKTRLIIFFKVVIIKTAQEIIRILGASGRLLRNRPDRAIRFNLFLTVSVAASPHSGSDQEKDFRFYPLRALRVFCAYGIRSVDFEAKAL
jgi:hypothetical protein